MIYTCFIQIDILITSIVFSFFLSRLYLHISSRTLVNNLSTFDLHLNISITISIRSLDHPVYAIVKRSHEKGNTNHRASIFRFNNWKLEADRYTREVFIYLRLSGHLRVYNPFFTYVIASLKHHFPLPLISTVATPTASRYSPIAHSRRVIPDYSQSPYLTLLPYKSSGRAVCSRYVARPFGLVPGRSSEERADRVVTDKFVGA